jgi:hypothetical protein
MTQAQKTHADAGTASLIQAAAVAFAVAVALSATLLFAGQYVFTIDLGGINQPQTAQSLIKAEAAWELQHKQQMVNGGASSAVVNSGLSWEQQRLQQAPSAAGTGIQGELHSEYLINLLGRDNEPTRFGPPGR